MKKIFLSIFALILLVSLVLTFNVQLTFAKVETGTITTTQLSASSITLGGSVTDNATITGTPSGGTVTFEVSTDGGNTFSPYGSTKTPSAGKATSDPYTPLSAGTYYFKAVFSGYEGAYIYDPSESGDTAEPLTVSESVPPVPELPAGMLFGLGLLGVGGFIFIKRRKAAATK